MAKLSEKEIEAKVLELGKQGITNEKIGLELKKQGIKPTDYKKRVSEILKQENLGKSSDIENIKKALEKLKKHSQNHKQDKTFARSFAIKTAKLRKLEKIKS